jgi:hypothetical protein
MRFLPMPDPETIKLAAQVTSTLVALLALFIGLPNEARNQKRFESQLAQGGKLAAAAARPLIIVGREGYEDEKVVTLENRGPGVAIVLSVSFVRGRRQATDISDLVDVPTKPEIIWDEINPYESYPYYLAAKSTEDMIRISAERLLDCGLDSKQASQLLDSIETQLDEIKIVVKYEDVFGQKFEVKA